MRLSKFAHVLKKGKRFCLYNALNMKMFFMNEDEFTYVQSYLKERIVAREVIDNVISAKIIVDDFFSEEEYLQRLNEKIFDGVQIRVMVLHLTDFCNLRCKYCFIEGNIGAAYHRINMSKDVVIKAIDKFIDILKDYKKQAHPSIVFYGGEPLANWETMKHALEYLEKYKAYQIDKILITNGTLITDDIATILKKYDVNVSVSLDGDEHCTNLNRVYLDGTGSYKDAIIGIERLRRAGIEPSISCVLAKENVSHACDIIDFFANELKIKALGFNHVSIVPNQNYYDETYEKSFARALIKVQERIQLKYPYIYERRMNHKINCFLDRKLLRADCTGCGEQMSVSPIGEIGICQGYMGSRKTFNNSVYDEDYFPKNDPIFIEWSKRSPLTMESCLDCIALATCGGGCPRNADVLTGSIWNPDKAFCHFAKEANEWMIWHMDTQEKGNVDN